MNIGDRFHILKWWPVVSRIENGRYTYGTYKRHCVVCGAGVEPEVPGPPEGNVPEITGAVDGCSVRQT